MYKEKGDPALSSSISSSLHACEASRGNKLKKTRAGSSPFSSPPLSPPHFFLSISLPSFSFGREINERKRGGEWRGRRWALHFPNQTEKMNVQNPARALRTTSFSCSPRSFSGFFPNFLQKKRRKGKKRKTVGGEAHEKMWALRPPRIFPPPNTFFSFVWPSFLCQTNP